MNKIKRGEIYYTDLSPVIGSEQKGVRPVLILQNEKAALPTHVPIKAEGLRKKSTVLLEQIRTIDKKRLIEYIGKLDKETMGKVDHAIVVSFGIKYLEALL